MIVGCGDVRLEGSSGWFLGVVLDWHNYESEIIWPLCKEWSGCWPRSLTDTVKTVGTRELRVRMEVIVWQWKWSLTDSYHIRVCRDIRKTGSGCLAWSLTDTVMRWRGGYISVRVGAVVGGVLDWHWVYVRCGDLSLRMWEWEWSLIDTVCKVGRGYFSIRTRVFIRRVSLISTVWTVGFR